MNGPFSRTLFELLREQAERYPSGIATLSAAIETSYAELAAQAGRVAAGLRERGIRRGDRVGILMTNRSEWLEICFGSTALGATVVPFSTWSTPQEMDFLLSDSRVKILFALARFRERDYASDLAQLLRAKRYPDLENVILVGDAIPTGFVDYREFSKRTAPADADLAGCGASAIDDAFVLYTSGTSSHPKAVRLQHYGVVENGFNIGERQGLRPGDRVLVSPPLFWSYGGANALPATFSHGATLVLQERFDAGESLALIEQYRCTAIYTLPSITKALLRHPDFARRRVSSLRTGLTIGSPQDIRDAVEQLGASELCNIYGATETYGNCCVTWHHWPVERRERCQGPPLPGVEFRFVDPENGIAAPPGQPGLAEVRGYVTPGYSGASAEQNGTTFTADGFYRTGDVGYLNEDGDFVFVSRNTEMIKKAGFNVSPAEIEDILLRHPDVDDAAVVGVPDPEKGEAVVAFVVPRQGATVTSDDLIGHCRLIASKYKVPDRVEICASLPLTPTSKLQRRELKASAAKLMANTKK